MHNVILDKLLAVERELQSLRDEAMWEVQRTESADRIKTPAYRVACGRAMGLDIACELIHRERRIAEAETP